MPDLLITGDLHTLAPPGSPLPPKVEALGVRDGRIVNWGSPGWVRAELGGRVQEMPYPERFSPASRTAMCTCSGPAAEPTDAI